VLRQLKELGLTGEFKKENNKTILSVEKKSGSKKLKDITPIQTESS